MTGEGDGQALAAGMKPRGAVLLLMGLALAGCGGLADRDGGGAPAATAQVQAPAGAVDVAAPDVFQVTERGLWDGRPSLGGVWVAHPDATDPERVRIVNQENGQEVVGALFRRERDLPGPALQLSSDAAEALGVLAGAPTEMEVTALRRREAPEEPPAPEEVPAEEAAPAAGAPTGEELAAALDAAPAAESPTPDLPPEAPADAPMAPPPPEPVVVDPAAIEAVAQATAAILAGAAAAPAPASGEIATTTLDGAAPAAASAPPGAQSGAIVQLGLFDVEANATAAAQSLAGQGLPAQVIPSGDAWRLILGPAAGEAEQTALLQAAVAAGFADAYLVSQ
jgi:hypothetical protein